MTIGGRGPGATIRRVEYERDELIRETASTDDQDVGASEDAIEYESKRAVTFRWIIGIGFFILCLALLIYLIVFAF